MLRCQRGFSKLEALIFTFFLMSANKDRFPIKVIVRATPLGTGFVDIFIGQIHSESDDQIQ